MIATSTFPTPTFPTRTASGTADAPSGLRWHTVCRYQDLLPERGTAALVGGRPVAVVRTHDGTVYAVDAVDPFSGAAVLARGIVGDRAGVPTVISPMYKQAFALPTGECLDEGGVRIAVYPVRVDDAEVQVAVPAGTGVR
jgi:nitrite reductase (NADH) small subunit